MFEFIISTGDVLLVIAIAIGGYFVRNSLPTYFSEKAKNLATKQDIDQITDQVESIKHLYSQDLESMKAQLGSRLFIHQTRYQNEFEILKNLSEKIVDLKYSVLLLRPTIDYIPEDDDADKKERLKKYFATVVSLMKVYEAGRPFYPDDLYQGLNELRGAVWKEAVEYKNWSYKPGRDFDPKYYEKAESNQQEITNLIDKVTELMRDRTKYWETFDIDTKTV